MYFKLYIITTDLSTEKTKNKLFKIGGTKSWIIYLYSIILYKVTKTKQKKLIRSSPLKYLNKIMTMDVFNLKETINHFFRITANKYNLHILLCLV